MKQHSEKNEQIKEIYRKITQIILQSIQTKGDYRTEEELRSKANLSMHKNNS